MPTEENEASIEVNVDKASTGTEQEPRKPQRWSHAADEILRKQFLKNARDKCSVELKNFVDCSKANGFMVLFRCKEQNKILNSCLGQYSKEEQYIEFRNQKVKELIEQGLIEGGVAPKPSF